MARRKYTKDSGLKDEVDKILELDQMGVPFIPPSRSESVGPRGSNPVVYLDITAFENGPQNEGINLGKLYIELRRDLLPVASSNFLSLCSGSKGVGEDGIRYHFKGIKIHRIYKDLLFQSGDLLNSDGNCSRSIYDGNVFRDENFIFRHAGPGCISYCNRGPDTNGSLFQMTFSHNPDLDNKYVVFGCLASDDSYNVLMKINKYGTISGKPKADVIITDCGIAYEIRY